MPDRYGMDSPPAFVRPPDRVIMIANSNKDACASGPSQQVNEEEEA